MSPTVFQLSPSRQQCSAIHVPRESTPYSEEILATPSSEQAIPSSDQAMPLSDQAMPSSDQATPSPEQMDTFPEQGHKDGTQGVNGSSEMPLGTKKSPPKKAKRVAGQRKQGVKRKNSKPILTLVAVSMSEKVHEKVCRARSKSDDSDDCGEPQKKKTRKFTRCPPHMRYLCEVCSKEDCGICNNCM